MGDEQPARECDLVMKGGIASGIVYPPAIFKLHEAKYRFRGIGGASAGAIAAAATAAAQHGEDRAALEGASGAAPATRGFAKLIDLNDALGRKGFILDLFQPTEDVRPFFEIALRVEKGLSAPAPGAAAAPAGEESLPWMILTRLPEIDRAFQRADGALYARGRAVGERWGAGLGAVLGGVIAIVSLLCVVAGAGSLRVSEVALAWSPGLIAGLLVCAGGFTLGRRIGGASRVLRGLLFDEVLIDSLFGACTGHSEDPARPALTDWLYTNLNELAGRDLGTPLTFGDLEGSLPGTKEIELRMVTTDLSYGQPCKLPFETHDFIFKKAEMLALFPAVVVDFMIASLPPEASKRLPEGYHRLPAGRLMPVIVATRMSLSFPLLLSAVPLYRLSNAAEQRFKHDPGSARAGVADLERHCFSDGGISSNFPIHFFDRWLPQRPTFGIMLTSTGDPEARPTLPAPKDYERARPGWKKIASLGDFLRSIVDTAISYRDNMQSILPSYRERIVQVPMMKGQGGLNLDMDPEVVAAMVKKGSDAGELLATKFDFAQHRWVRLRVLTAHLEHELGPLRQTFQLAPEQGSIIDAELAAFTRASASHDDAQKWYRPEGAAWCHEATKRMNALMTLAASWEEPWTAPHHHHAPEAPEGGLPAFFSAAPAAPSTAASPGATPAQSPQPPAFFNRSPPVPDSALRITPEL